MEENSPEMKESSVQIKKAQPKEVVREISAN